MEHLETLHPIMGSKLKFITSFWSQIDEQSERTIQTLADMLQICVLDFSEHWEKHLPLIESASNNSYQASINMSPYETLYGRKW